MRLARNPNLGIESLLQDNITGRFHSLDALRGVAAFMVVATHVGTRIPADYHLAQSGYLAVDFFFLLSGFVIAHAYQRRLAAGLSLLEFGILRGIRLYPLIVLGVTIGAIDQLVRTLTGISPDGTLGQLAFAFATNVVVLPTPHRGYLFPLNAPEWSLFTEIGINLLFAALLFRLRWRMLLAIAIVTLLVMLAQIAWVPEASVMTGGWSGRTIPIAITRTTFSFVAGVVIFHLSAGRPRRRSRWVLPLVAAALITLMAQPLSPRWSDTVHLVSVAVLFPAFLWLAATHEPPQALTATTAWLGDLSYPLYAIHYPLLAIYVAAAGPQQGRVVVYCLIYLALSVAAAYLALRCYDAPLRRWMSHRLKRRESAKPVAFDSA